MGKGYGGTMIYLFCVKEDRHKNIESVTETNKRGAKKRNFTPLFIINASSVMVHKH